MAESRLPLADLYRESAKLPVVTRARVMELVEKARGYVWGWQDAGGAKRGIVDDWNFPILYGWHAYRYAVGDSSGQDSIQDCFQRYLRGETF